jgi:hypothetical protein
MRYTKLLAVLLLAGCYNAAPWCTKERPCTAPKDSTKADTTKGVNDGRK